PPSPLSRRACHRPMHQEAGPSVWLLASRGCPASRRRHLLQSGKATSTFPHHRGRLAALWPLSRIPSELSRQLLENQQHVKGHAERAHGSHHTASETGHLCT